jgi:ubiquitin C-terminal hydrolase
MTKLQDEGVHTEEALVTPTEFVNAADDRYLGRRFKPHKLVDWKRRLQQDAQEYLMSSTDGLLLALQSDLVKNERTDFTKKLFSGAWQTTTSCSSDGCANVSVYTEPISDVFQLAIQMDKTAKHLTLDGLLEGFFQEEKLDDDNKWFCEEYVRFIRLNPPLLIHVCSCQRYIEGDRRLRISQAPRVLIIHLKRFAMTWAGADPKAEKARNSVRLSPTVSLSNYLAGSRPAKADYSLSGVLCHHGKNMESGHYTSYVRGGENNANWAHFDDLNEKCPVRMCDAKEVLKGRDAYVLFYEQMDSRK